MQSLFQESGTWNLMPSELGPMAYNYSCFSFSSSSLFLDVNQKPPFAFLLFLWSPSSFPPSFVHISACCSLLLNTPLSDPNQGAWLSSSLLSLLTVAGLHISSDMYFFSETLIILPSSILLRSLLNPYIRRRRAPKTTRQPLFPSRPMIFKLSTSNMWVTFQRAGLST